jgi:hypothetical protein
VDIGVHWGYSLLLLQVRQWAGSSAPRGGGSSDGTSATGKAVRRRSFQGKSILADRRRPAWFHARH